MKRSRYRARTDPKHRSRNPRRRTPRIKAKRPSQVHKRDWTYINVSDKMKHNRGPR